MIVRIFGFRGMEQMPVSLPKYFSSDSVYQLVYPYDWKASLTTNGVTPVSASAPADGGGVITSILRVEVPDGQSIRYEINPPTRQGGVLAAGINSPILSGINMFYFRGGFSFSCIDAAGT